MQNLSNINIEKDKVIVTINPNIYPLDVIYSASYVFLDRAYILIDGNPKEKVMVEIKPKKSDNLKEIGLEFNNELLNYANYKSISEKNKEIRTAIIQRALLTNEVKVSEEEELDSDTKKLLDSLESEQTDFEDPAGIAVPWEEKYGKDNDDKSK